MKKIFYLLTELFLLYFVFLSSAYAIGMRSTNYNISVDIIASGGGIATSTTYKINQTIVIGESTIFFINSSQYIIKTGFLYPIQESIKNRTNKTSYIQNGGGLKKVSIIEPVINPVITPLPEITFIDVIRYFRTLPYQIWVYILLFITSFSLFFLHSLFSLHKYKKLSFKLLSYIKKHTKKHKIISLT